MNSFLQAIRIRLTKSMMSGIGACALFLVGCGGGGGGSNVTNPAESATSDTSLSFEKVSTSTSTQTTTYEATSILINFGARAHLTDVDAIPSAPGKGTTIAVIDDFNSLIASTTTLPLINRAITAHTASERYTATYKVAYQLDTPFNHGKLVSNIAGGYSDVITRKVSLTAPAADTTDLVTCAISYQATQLACPNAFHTSAPSSTLQASLYVPAIPGVASEATVTPLHVDLSSAQNSTNTDAAIYGHLINSLKSSTVNVINLSLGSDMPVSTDLAADLQTIVNAYRITKPATAVITVAAGNSSTPCGVNYFGCNIMAMALVLQTNSVNSTIVAGALTGSGTSQTIANYSTLPGDLANRLIFASGETGFYKNANGNNAVGTSFAAPRVAGAAAIIKQKFPRLSSDQIAQIILDSGDRDMNNDGTPDFVGVDPIFGNGKLSIKNALALAATY